MTKEINTFPWTWPVFFFLAVMTCVAVVLTAVYVYHHATHYAYYVFIIPVGFIGAYICKKWLGWSIDRFDDECLKDRR
jgi:hypothetical protein